MTIMYCNVKLRKLLSAHKSHVTETSLFTGAIPNPVHNSQTSRFVSVPGQNPERSSRGACLFVGVNPFVLLCQCLRLVCECIRSCVCVFMTVFVSISYRCVTVCM